MQTSPLTVLHHFFLQQSVPLDPIALLYYNTRRADTYITSSRWIRRNMRRLLLTHLLPPQSAFPTSPSSIGAIQVNQPHSVLSVISAWAGVLLWSNHLATTLDRIFVYASSALQKYANLLMTVYPHPFIEESSLFTALSHTRGSRSGNALQFFLSKESVMDQGAHLFSDTIRHQHLLTAMRGKDFFTAGLSLLAEKNTSLVYPIPVFHLSYSIQTFFLNIVRIQYWQCCELSKRITIR